MDSDVEILDALAWPLTILLLAWLLRHEVRAAFGRIEGAKFGSTELSFGTTKADDPRQRRASRPDAESVTGGEWTKTATVYWLGHDIMWTIDAVLRSADRGTVLHGHIQAKHHLDGVGLGDSPMGRRLAALEERATRSLDSDWTVALREEYALELGRLSDQLGAIAEVQQRGFTAGPQFGDERPDTSLTP